MTRQEMVFILAVCLGFFATPGFAQEVGQTEREAIYYRYLEFASYVKGGSIEPHWMADGSSFWYAEGAPGNTVGAHVAVSLNSFFERKVFTEI